MHFQLTAISPMGSSNGNGKDSATSEMPTSVINRRLLLVEDCKHGSVLEHIRGLIWISNVCAINDERASELFYHKIFLDPVMTWNF
jgi:hypothetical protein